MIDKYLPCKFLGSGVVFLNSKSSEVSHVVSKLPDSVENLIWLEDQDKCFLIIQTHNLPRKGAIEKEKKEIWKRFNVVSPALGFTTMTIDWHVPEQIFENIWDYIYERIFILIDSTDVKRSPWSASQEMLLGRMYVEAPLILVRSCQAKVNLELRNVTLTDFHKKKHLAVIEYLEPCEWSTRCESPVNRPAGSLASHPCSRCWCDWHVCIPHICYICHICVYLIFVIFVIFPAQDVFVIDTCVCVNEMTNMRHAQCAQVNEQTNTTNKQIPDEATRGENSSDWYHHQWGVPN